MLKNKILRKIKWLLHPPTQEQIVNERKRLNNLYQQLFDLVEIRFSIYKEKYPDISCTMPTSQERQHILKTIRNDYEYQYLLKQLNHVNRLVFNHLKIHRVFYNQKINENYNKELVNYMRTRIQHNNFAKRISPATDRV